MRHPLEFISNQYRARSFFMFLVLTLILFAVFRVLDQPLRTAVAPYGIVSFELAGTPEKAFQIMVSWEPAGVVSPDILRIQGYLYAAFCLGIDYLFMPVYALTLAFGTLLARQKQEGWMWSLGAIAGYAAYAAAIFDAIENYALLRVLLGEFESGYPAIAALSAMVKFGLIVFGVLYGLVAWLLPKR